MPKVFAWNGYRFHFFSEEGDPRERLAALDAMTDEDIARQIADNPDAALS